MKTRVSFLGDLLAAIIHGASARELRNIVEEALRYGRQHPQDAAYVQFLAFMQEVKAARCARGGARSPKAASKRSRWSHCIRLSLECEGSDTRGGWDPARQAFRFVGILPGRHRLWTDTGWLLWEQDLCAEHLLTTAAFPWHPVRLAADSFGLKARPTAEWDLLGQTVQVRTYPGIEAGCVEVVLSRGEVDRGAC